MPRNSANSPFVFLRNRLRSVFTRLNYLSQTIRLVWAAARAWTLLWAASLVIQGFLPVAIVYLTRILVDRLVAGVGAGVSWEAIQPVLIPTALMIGVLFVGEVLNGLTEWIRTAQSELVQDHISALIHRHSVAVDYGFYESSECNDQLERARDGASSRSLALLENTGSVLQNSITLFVMAAVLLPYGLWLSIVLFLSAIPTFYIVLRLNRLQYQWSQRTTTARRRLQYYDVILTHSLPAAELRLFNLGSYFQSLYQKLRERLRTEQLNLIKQQSLGRFGAGIVALLLTGVVLAWMGRQLLLGAITLGDLALFYQAFNKGQTIVKSLLSNLGQIYRNSLFVENLFEFLKIQPQIVDPPQPLPVPAQVQQNIRFQNVTFRYPGSQEAVLENFSLTIPAGKIVAIVGDNGAGKSTLIKLLCRFYDPERGEIEIDGINIRRFSVQRFRQLITVLFQSPIEYYLTAGQSIALGDIAAQPTQDDIETASKWAGIHEKIMSLPHGYDSTLGKWFPGGTDLSGGEWQRLALARAYLREAPIIILDEPTSAMDPWAESAWLKRFRKMASHQTAIVITHRFTLAMQADMIHVMRTGQIVESGSHEDLLSRDGLYAQSWKAQTQLDRKSAVENSLT